MSLNLLRTTVGGSTRFSAKFRNNGATSATDTEFFTCEYDRMVYSMWRRETDPIQYHVSQFNIQTAVTTYIGYVTSAQIGYTDLIGGWLCDGEYMYFIISGGRNVIVRIRIEDQTRTQYTNDIGFTCWGRCQWYNDHTIAIMDLRGIALFDTKTTSFSHIRYKPSDTSNCTQFCITDKLIADTSDNTGAEFAWYNRLTETYNTTTLPVSDYPSELCYGDGKFYVINRAYIFIFNEETETWELEYIPVQFTTAGVDRPYPAEIRYCVYAEGVVYIIVEGSNRLWAFDPESKKVTYKLLPWNVPGYDISDVGWRDYRGYQCTISSFHRYMFIQCYSFGYISYEGLYKYNAGYKYLQYIIPCAEDLLDYESKDPCIVSKPSYLTYEVMPDEIPFTPTYEGSTIKSAPVNKNNYKEILNIKLQ